ncbi:Protein of unknown function [Mesorhizobium albiziae]|uniref:DUF992 domain-containing protein n=1 Tax=Neomesorhizobium albiziae TaxID=335020 RepID=A0A1I4AHD7_9HYPH|nr:DUF992 domain-containing protein [Mesorhizobium albiziae]GLS32872.1 hypothetical protein GCM10007937_45820 [Mesorhizobium albiziae]SFK55838.1 Protein of unknown function [Mesorhizobium albiziae]
MKTALATVLAAQLAFAVISVAYGADFPAEREPDASGGVKIGYLDCAVGSGLGYVVGSAKQIDCVFQSSGGSGRSESYTGTIRKLGIDLGYTTRGRLVWAVFAPTAGYHRGSLGGLYEGATAEATLGAGVGANILVGGTSGSIQLQTVSVTGQLGLNVAATGTSMTLNATN